MLVRRRLTDLQDARDLPIGRSLRDEVDDLLLPRCERYTAIASKVSRRKPGDHLHEAIQDRAGKGALALRRCCDGPIERLWGRVARNESHEAKAGGLSARLRRRRGHERDKTRSPA